MPDVDVDRPWLAIRRVAPDRLEQRAPAEDLARLRDESPQELELDVREVERLSVDSGDAPLGVERNVARHERLDPGHVARRNACAPEQRPDPAPELADRERLGDVVVGAELEPEHRVELV